MTLRWKILITIGLAILYSLFLQFMYGQTEKSRSAYQNDWLKTWYGSYNETYFQSELPKDVGITWANLAVVQFDGSLEFRTIAETVFGDGYIRIRIDRTTNIARSTARLSILHEMCHVENHVENHGFVEHGPEWQACMMRLAKAGAFTEIW